MKQNLQSAVLILGCCGVLALAGQGQGRGQGAGRRMSGPAMTPQSQGQGQGRGTMTGQPSNRAMQGSGRSAVDHMQRHPEQAARVQEMLPPGTDVNAAADGFKNFGQFVAAAHVSKNLNIPFDQLKQKMTGPDSKSLGDAIHELKPDLPAGQVKEAVKAAKQEEKQVRRESQTKRHEGKGSTS